MTILCRARSNASRGFEKNEHMILFGDLFDSSTYTCAAYQMWKNADMWIGSELEGESFTFGTFPQLSEHCVCLHCIQVIIPLSAIVVAECLFAGDFFCNIVWMMRIFPHSMHEAAMLRYENANSPHRRALFSNTVLRCGVSNSNMVQYYLSQVSMISLHCEVHVRCFPWTSTNYTQRRIAYYRRIRERTNSTHFFRLGLYLLNHLRRAFILRSFSVCHFISPSHSERLLVQNKAITNSSWSWCISNELDREYRR